jgi:hypothetical protein
VKRRDKEDDQTDQFEPIDFEHKGEPGFIVPRNWNEDEIADAMKAFEEHIRRERGLPPAHA